MSAELLTGLRSVSPPDSENASSSADPANAEMKALVETIFQKVWIVNEPSAFDTLYHENLEVEGLVPNTTIGLEEFKSTVADMRISQEMLGYRVVDFIGDGQTRCAITIEYDVYIPAADKTAKLVVNCFYQIEKQRARKVRIAIDRLDLLEKIGAAPEGAYFIGLSGGKLA